MSNFSFRKAQALKSIKGLRALMYLGDNFTCPVCEGSFRTFLPFGVKKRQNARCPRCSSLERHRYFWLYYNNETNLFKENLKILHVAPEFIFQKKFIKMKNLDYYSVDLYSPLADYHMDITKLEFADNMFDVILCNDVLEHVENDAAAIKELNRVLKPGGWAIIQVPLDKSLDTTLEDPSITSPKEREKHFGRFDHVRQFGRDYEQRLRQGGWVVSVKNYKATLDETTISRYALNTDRDIYFCEKV